MLTSTLFWQFLQPCWCQTVAALLFLWICQWDGGGTGCMGNSLSSISQCPGLYPSTPLTIHLQLHLERTLQLCHLYGVDSTREATDTSYKPSLNWHRVQHQGLLPTVGEILVSHWTATTCLKLGSPQSVRCCPTTVCFLHWVHGD